MVLTRKLHAIALLLVSLTTVFIMAKRGNKSFDLPSERIEKRDLELEGIRSKTHSRTSCVQYALVAAMDGYYPCYNCPGEQMIYLRVGEVWKYGKTCIGEDKRYGDLSERNLLFVPQFKGDEKDCLIMEKQKIYAYALLPENSIRARKLGVEPLLRPPGNKIDR